MSLPKHRSQIPFFSTLDGDHVRIRSFQPDDADTLFAAIQESREHLQRWLPWVPNYESVADSRDFIARAQARYLLREAFDLGLFDRQSGALLGGIGLHPHDWNIGYVEIGYWLRTSAEGHGYMTEAVRALTSYAFASLSAHRVQIRCDARNERSAAVAVRAGYLQEAHLRNHRRGQDGILRDTLIYAMTPDDIH